MNIKITVEFARDLDFEAREAVTIVHNISTIEEPSVEQIRDALDRFRQAIDATERIPVA